MFNGDALPTVGAPAAQIEAEIAALRATDLPTRGGRLFAYVYDPAVPGLDELTGTAYALAGGVNGLDPTAFPSLLAMENALVGAASRLLGGGPDGVATVVGSVTAGGTESLLLAVKAARDAHPDVTAPELVVPSTAHAAFAKAAAYLRVALVSVSVDATTLRPDPAAMAAAITDRTVLVACSAPSYAHGVIDPVPAIAAVAAARGVRCHVDACFGGWALPFLRRLGAPVPPFDFAVDGVTSISVDLHKYAYCPKGLSVLLHRDEALRAPQYFAYADWPGYTMVNATVASTRPGGPIAAGFATLRHLGEEGYLRLTRLTWDAVQAIASTVDATPGLRRLSDGPSTVVTFTADDPGLDLFVLADELAARGWHTQPQPAHADLPRSIHLTVTAAVAPEVDAFVLDLAAAVAATRAAGPVTLDPGLIELARTIDPAELTASTVEALAAGLGLGLGGERPLPERQADINTLVEAAPPATRAALFAGFLSLLQRPTYRPAPGAATGDPEPSELGQ